MCQYKTAYQINNIVLGSYWFVKFSAGIQLWHVKRTMSVRGLGVDHQHPEIEWFGTSRTLLSHKHSAELHTHKKNNNNNIKPRLYAVRRMVPYAMRVRYAAAEALASSLSQRERSQQSHIHRFCFASVALYKCGRTHQQTVPLWAADKIWSWSKFTYSG